MLVAICDHLKITSFDCKIQGPLLLLRPNSCFKFKRPEILYVVVAPIILIREKEELITISFP